MNVIELTERTIFVDDIKQIYQEDNYCPTRYTVSTKNGDYRINQEDYYKIQQYLLSLNEPIYEELPKEYKKIAKIGKLNQVSDNKQHLNNYILRNKINEIIDMLSGKDINEIPQFQGTLESLDKLNLRGEDNE